MTPIKDRIQHWGMTLLGALAVAEHVALVWWGVISPWRSLAAYPGDGGVNDYLILASGLLVAVSLSAAAAYRRVVPRLPLLAAMAVALPLAVGVLLGLLNAAFLDPAVDYLTLLPSVAAAIAPYALAARLTG